MFIVPQRLRPRAFTCPLRTYQLSTLSYVGSIFTRIFGIELVSNSKTTLIYTVVNGTDQHSEKCMMTLVNIQWIRVKRVFTLNALNNIDLSLVLITLIILNNNKIDPHGINYFNVVYFRAMLHLLHVSSSIKSKTSIYYYF